MKSRCWRCSLLVVAAECSTSRGRRGACAADEREADD